MSLTIIGVVVIAVIVLASIRVINEYQRGVVFTLGKFTGTYNPGLKLVIPIIQRMVIIDIRTLVQDIPKQQIMTKDNVPVNVNGVVFFRVTKPADAVLQVEDYKYAVMMSSQTSLRDVVGGMTLDNVLVERQKIGEAIEQIVDKETDPWGIVVESIKLQDIEVPDHLKQIMSRQAAAEREKRANIIKSEGDREAAKNLAYAANIMSQTKGAMQLRTLQTLDGLGPTASNTVVMALPIEVLEYFHK